MTRALPAEDMTCDDQQIPSTLEYSIDATTLSGTARQAGQCQSGQLAVIESPISLTKVG
jgi:hypothetical protein